ncbi:NlpC/P60 family protein [Fusobacterium necrophorum subsp. funduliforme]|uniref:C40 family peptidase n=1 Tax=Fusobacterium necrophorum TaxID=859 RepID=UPI00370F09F0
MKNKKIEYEERKHKNIKEGIETSVKKVEADSKYGKEDFSMLKNEKESYQKRNFDNKEFTRNRDKETKVFQNVQNNSKEKVEGNTSKNEKDKKRVDKKFQKEEKKISKLQQKQKLQEKKSGSQKKDIFTKGAILTTTMLAYYMKRGKEENAGVYAGHKVTEKAERFTRTSYHRRKKNIQVRKWKISKLKRRIEKKEKKFFLKKNDERWKQKTESQNSPKVKQFFKRLLYKKQIQERYRTRVKNTVKKYFMENGMKFLVILKLRAKKIGFFALFLVGTFFMLFQIGSMVLSMGTGMVNNTVATTYLSSEEILKAINQEFSSLEQQLQEEMETVEQRHPGYDEYIITGKEKIGHEVHELLSYITARYGIVKEVSEIQGDLQSLFEKMYTLTYREEIEVRYTASGEPYLYRKLIVTLEKREMDEVIREIFQSYPDNLSHYEGLLTSKGNMENVFGDGKKNFSKIIKNATFFNPGLTFHETNVKRIMEEAEKHIGKRYMFGANGPNNFDCSSFVCWTYTESGMKNMPRTTAWGIYQEYCEPINPSEAKAGDIIFFKRTYESGSPISHVGIYAGDEYMIHAGDPIQYEKIDTPYWKEHFYGMGRVRQEGNFE